MRLRLFSLISVLALVLLAAIPASANGEQNGGNHGGSYLALGDSVPFGFSPLANPTDADNFVGYPEIVAHALDLRDVNATCPGEATGGFLSLTGTDNGCHPYRFILDYPLHVHYNGSQMAFALAYLHAHKHNTALITLTLGANDVFRWQSDCKAGPMVGTCPLGFDGVLGVMRVNLNTILGNIRAAGYAGPIVAVTYYALNYKDPVIAGGSIALNNQMAAAAAANGALIASGFDAWAPMAALANGDSCAAGLLIALPDGTCNVHPTPLGRDLLAAAVLKTLGEQNDRDGQQN